jgi:hypothetical protein
MVIIPPQKQQRRRQCGNCAWRGRHQVDGASSTYVYCMRGTHLVDLSLMSRRPDLRSVYDSCDVWDGELDGVEK